MQETEIERLIVRLLGDPAQYVSSMDKSVEKTVQAANQVEQHAKRVEQFGTGLKSFATNVLSVLGSFGVAMTLGGAFQSFTQAEKTMDRFKATIEASGRAVEPVIADYKEFIKTMTDATTASKGQIISALQQAEMMGMQGDKAKEAVKIAQALSAADVHGRSTESFVRAAYAMQQGNAQVLRYQLGLRGVHDESQIMAMAQQKVAAGIKIAAKENESAAGQIEKLGRSLKEVSVEIGGMVASVIMPFVEKTRQLVDWFNQLDPSTRRIAVAALALMGAIVGIRPALAALAPILGVLKTLFMSVFNHPVLLLVTIAIAGLVQYLGGMEAAWTKIKAAAEAAWKWLEPVRGAISGFLSQLWDNLKEVWDGAVKLAAEAWAAIFGDVKINWTKIRDFIRDVFIFLEFILLNFKSSVGIAWQFIKNIVAQTVGEIQEKVGVELLDPTTIDKWKREFQGSLESATTAWGDFYKRKLDELGKGMAGPQKEATKIGANMSDGIQKAKHHVDNLHAALTGSAEAISRYEKYINVLRGGTTGTGVSPGGGTGGAGGAPAADAAVAKAAAAVAAAVGMGGAAAAAGGGGSPIGNATGAIVGLAEAAKKADDALKLMGKTAELKGGGFLPPGQVLEIKDTALLRKIASAFITSNFWGWPSAETEGRIRRSQDITEGKIAKEQRQTWLPGATGQMATPQEILDWQQKQYALLDKINNNLQAIKDNAANIAIAGLSAGAV